MTPWNFTIPGKLWGYKQGRREAFRSERVEFKDKVRLLANVAGVPEVAMEGDELFLEVYIRWRLKARIDGVNVYKLIEDSLWRQDRGVAGGRWERRLSQGYESALIIVSRQGGVTPYLTNPPASSPASCPRRSLP